MCDNRFELSSVIQQYHVYKDIVMPPIRKILQSGREPDNSYDSFGVAIIENYIIILSVDMCLGILLVRIPHHVLNDKSKQIYRKLRGYLFSRFTKYPRNFLSLKIIRPTVCCIEQTTIKMFCVHNEALQNWKFNIIYIYVYKALKFCVLAKKSVWQ